MRAEEAMELKQQIISELVECNPHAFLVNVDSYPDAIYGADGTEDDYVVWIVEPARLGRTDVRSWADWEAVKRTARRREARQEDAR